MKWLLVIVPIIICSCTTVKEARKTTTTVVLDSSGSYIKGGDGKGYFTMWNWKQIAGEKATIENPSAAVTRAYITNGNYVWQMTITDNLGQTKTDTVSYKLK